MIDNSSCLNAINTIKGHISACFTQCTAKGSTFSGTKNLSNLSGKELENAIDISNIEINSVFIVLYFLIVKHYV